MQDRIRRASVDDQVAITRLVHQARLNPRGLDWRRFVIAEAGDAPIGVAEVRRHSDGSRELASLAVGLLRPTVTGRRRVWRKRRSHLQRELGECSG